MRRGGSIGILLVAIVGVAMLTFAAWAPKRLVWNFTPSIPVGLYVIEDRAWRRGERVALWPSGELLDALREAGVLREGRMLMKRVAAAAGDEVCRYGLQVTINTSPSAVARLRGDLPSWSGCIRLTASDVFLLGETENSFDGRYFGVTAAGDVVGPIRSLLTF